MNAPCDAVARVLAAYLESGLVVRIGEASVLGRALILPDERRMDLVHVRRSPVDPGPLCLCVCHFPATVGFEGVRRALLDGVQAFSATHASGGNPPELRILSGRPLLPEMALSVSVNGRTHSIQCELSVPDELVPIAFYLVAAVEEYLAAQGAPPRLIRRIRRCRDEKVLSARPRAAPARLPLWLAKLLRRSSGPGAGTAATAAGALAWFAAADREVAGAGQLSRPDRTWRKLLMPAPRRQVPGCAPAGRDRAVDPASTGPSRIVRSVRRAAITGSLDLSATFGRAALRRPGPGCDRRVSVAREDLRFASLPEPRDVDRCLLLDASASMAGDRARAAARMADFFLRNSRGRMAVIAFQGREGQVLTGFTRSRRQLSQAMLRFRPAGLTPLAAGLLLAFRTVVRAGARRAQVVLVTDGEPNKSLWSHEPVVDALRAVQLFRRSGISLVCCGLQGNESILGQLSVRGGGRLFVLRDFSTDSLLSVSRRLLQVKTY